MNIKTAHGFSICHKHLILKSKMCGCFYCLEIFPPSEIKNWTDGKLLRRRLVDGKQGQTAICPRCMIDSVLPDCMPITKNFLRKMKRYWFMVRYKYRLE